MEIPDKGKLVPLTIYTTGERELIGVAWIRKDEVVCYLDEESTHIITIAEGAGTLRAFSIVPKPPVKHKPDPALAYRVT